MAWQSITTTNTEQAFYRDLLAQLVQFATSKHIASVDNIDAGSAGYVVGDILTYTHASALHDATFEVTAVAAGVITQLRIINGGSFGRRVATVTVNAGGTNYATGDIVELATGVAGTDFRQRCKLEITNQSGGVVQAGGATIFEGGGNYDGGTDPLATAATTTKIGPAAGTGAGLTVDTTMQAITSNLNLALTGGTGTGAQVDVTLTNTGHVVLRDDHDYTTPHGETDEKQVVLQGTVVGGDEPLVGYVSWFDESGVDDFWGLLEVAMDTYNDGLALENQIGANPSSDVPSATAGAYIPSLNEVETSWFSVDGRKLAGVHKTVGTTVTAYHQHYLGLFDPFGTTVEAPYPLVMAGSISGTRTWHAGSTASVDVTGITEAFRNTNRTASIFYRRVADGSWLGITNAQGTAFPLAAQSARTVFPIGAPTQGQSGDDDFIEGAGNFAWFSTICQNTGAAATVLLKPAPGDDSHEILPVVVELRASKTAPIEFGPAGRFANVFWCGATKTDDTTIGAEDTFTDPGDPTIVYRAFPNGVRTTPYSFMCMQEGV